MNEKQADIVVKTLAGVWIIRLAPLAIVGALAAGVWLAMGLPFVLLANHLEKQNQGGE